MQTNNNEQIIYLKDLFFSVLYSWKKILILAVVLAMVLGGWKGLSSYRSAKAAEGSDPSVYAEKLEAYEEEKAALESKLESIQNNIDHLTTYIEKSAFMQIDPYAFYEVSVSLFADTGYQVNPGLAYQTPDRTLAVLNGYATMITGDTFMRAVAKELDIEATYLPELFSTTILENKNTLQVSVKFPTSEGAHAVLEMIKKQLAENQASIADSIAAHTLNFIQSDVRQLSDITLADLQTAQEQKLLDLYDSMQVLEDEISALAAPQLDAGSLSKSAIVKSAVIFAVIGGIAGLFIGVLAAWVCHICSNKVYSARTLTNRTQVKVLGCLNAEEKQCRITKLVRKLDDRNLADSAYQAKLITSNIRNLCAGSQHLLVACAAENAVLSAALQQAMPDVKVTICGSLLSDIDAIDALAQCNRVLLVEQCNTSKYAHIQQSVELIANNEKTLLGCVLLNG